MLLIRDGINAFKYPILWMGLFVCLSNTITLAQNASLPKVIPPSPDAASLGKFGDMPVGYYTGTPSISVPLYNLNAGNFTLPISLSYHASGVKVEEEAGFVGLGWALQGGGVITKSTKNISDFESFGYPQSSVPDPNDVNYMQAVAMGHADPEPDIFYFNFAGKSGKFIMHSLQQSADCMDVTLINQEKICVTYNFTTHAWTITTDNGIRYIFGVQEYNLPQSASSDVSAASAKSSLLSSPSFVSSWYLSEIILTNNESIYFDYANGWDEGFSSKSRISVNQTIRIPYDSYGGETCQDAGAPLISYSASKNTFFNVYLRKIRFRNLYLDFITENRTDIEPEPSSSKLPQRLKQVNIYAIDNAVNKLIKTYEFGYEYFNEGIPNLDPYEYTRLKLAYVREVNGAEENPPYKFSYYDSQEDDYELPGKDSYSRDYWGFFNGKNNENIHSSHYNNQWIGGSLIPPFADDFGYGLIQDSGADRSPDPELTKVGVLTRVDYPTGGSTVFDFEAHQYTTSERVVIDVPLQTLYQNGPMVTNPPAPDFDRIQIDLEYGTTVKIDVVLYCDLWQETGGHCQLNTGHTGVINRLLEGSQTEFFMSFPTGSVQYDQSYHYEYEVDLPPGSYEILADLDYDGWVTIMDIDYDQPTGGFHLVSKPVGGVRVARITEKGESNNSPDKVTKFVYDDGLLMNDRQVFHYFEKSYAFCSSSQDAASFFLTRKSSSNYPLGSGAQGSHIGYGTVTALYGENGENGKTVYNYMNYPEEVAPDPPIPDETMTVPNENGFLLSQLDYKRKSDGTFQKLKLKENVYNDDTDLTKYISGFKSYTANGPGNLPYVCLYKPYVLESERWNLIQEVITTFDPDDENKSLVTTTDYAYDNPDHYQLTSTKQTANSRTIITELKYPADFEDADADPVTLDMKNNKFIHNAVLQKTILQDKNNVQEVLNSTITRYGANYLPSEIAVFEPASPVANNTTAFPLYKPVNGYDITKFEKKLIFKYDTRGNIIEYQQPNNTVMSYLWDPDGNNPLAEITNASDGQSFHTSFEYSGGTAGTARTGTRYYNQGSYTIPFTPPAGTTCLMSYWYWENDQWKFSGQVPFSATINQGSRLDEIRVFPAGARITTYSYKPFVGVSSATDNNNVSRLFEYDLLGRLRAVYDNDKNVTSGYTYHYKAQ